MPCLLPAHGRVDCTLCHATDAVEFDRTRTEQEGWRITSNPMAWGGREPKVIVLGFSKGPNQAGALASSPYDEIAYKGGRVAVGKVFARVGILPPSDNAKLKSSVDQLIAAPNGPIHFASLVRCTVERFDPGAGHWKGSGGGMLDKFLATAFGQKVASNCTKTFLGNLPPSVRLIVMFGLGARGNYVRSARKLIEKARPGEWRQINDVVYADQQLTVVHVEHFASQGTLLPNWLGQTSHPRARLGEMASDASRKALGLAPTEALLKLDGI